MQRKQMSGTTKRDPRYWRNLRIFGLVSLLAGLLFAWCVALPLDRANAMTHPPRLAVCCVTPGDRGIVYEDVTFTTADGVALSGWYIPSRNRAAVMVLHGLSGNRLSRLDAAMTLAEQGYGVLVFDLRAHGASGGDTVSFGAQDALAALAFLQQRAGVDPNRIGALGLSLGAVVITNAAAQTDGISAVVLEGLGQGAFEDFPPPDDVREVLMTPYRWVVYQTLIWRRVSPAPMVDVIGDLSPRPILLISGAGGSLERRSVRRYYAAAGEPKTLWEIPEADHAGTWLARPDEFADKIVAFFDQALLVNR